MLTTPISSPQPAYVQVVTQEPTYVLSTGKEDELRLTILNEIYNAASLAALKITPGLNVLTVGCGIGLLEVEIAKEVSPSGSVVGTDISREQLQIAEQNAASANLTNLEFRHVEALKLDLIPGLFDRIHCRFVLTHLTWETILQILPMLDKKLAPGGFILLEELASMESLGCEPPHPGYDKWRELSRNQYVLQKTGSSNGSKIFQYLRAQGRQATCTSWQALLITPREKSILALGVLSARKRMIEEHVYTSAEIDEMVLELRDLEQNPAIVARNGEIIRITVE